METKITSTYKIYEDNSIIHLIIHEGSELSYNDAKEIDAYIKNHLGSKRHLKLLDARASFTMQSLAKSFFESPKVKLKMQAQAVLIGSNTKQQVIDLFSEMNGPKLPSKLFVDYDEAIRWLNTFKITRT